MKKNPVKHVSISQPISVFVVATSNETKKPEEKKVTQVETTEVDEKGEEEPKPFKKNLNSKTKK